MVVAAIREVWSLLIDTRLRQAVEAMEDFADSPSLRLIVQHERAIEEVYIDAAEGIYPDHQSHRQAESLARAPWQLVSIDLGADDPDPFWAYIVEGLQEVEFPGRTIPEAKAVHLRLFHDIFPNPFRPVAFDPDWRTSTAVAIAQAAYDARAFGNLPVLADALQDAGCENADILDHLRGPGPHVRGCWAVDLVLGKT